MTMTMNKSRSVFSWLFRPCERGAAPPGQEPTVSKRSPSSSWYGEMVPFTGRTHLVVVSRSKVREYEEYCFAMFKETHKSKILGYNHPDTVRVRDITHKIISAASSALAVEQSGLVDLVDGLNWEVIVVRDLPGYAKCYPGAGKIIATTRLLDSFETDAEIAVSIAHEVGHVVARHSSEIAYRTMCFPKIALLPIFRRNEAEADHIGMLLHVAAGYDPHVVLEVLSKYIKIAEGSSRMRKLLNAHPSAKKRLRLLSEPKVMEEALNLYKQVNDIRDGVGLSM